MSEHERSFIAAAMLDPTHIDAIGDRLSGDDFADRELGKFFEVLRDRHDAGLPVNDASLLASAGREVFGDKALTMIGELAIELPHAAHGKHYAERVIAGSRRRKLLALSEEIRDRCNAVDDPDEITRFVDAKLPAIGLRTASKPVTAFEAATQLIAELESPSERRPIRSGIDSLDNVAGGLMPGELEIIAARPGAGKTSFAMQIAKRVAQQNRPVMFVSLEMRSTELIGRILAGDSGVDGSQLRNGQADPARLMPAVADLDGMPLVISDPPTASMAQIRALAKMQAATRGLDLLVVDYIGLVKPRDRKIPRTEQVAEISGALKRLAKELEIPVIALCQLNRQADGAKPILSHLRESGAIEQDADVVLFLHREEQNGNGFKIIIAKHRHGQTGELSAIFDAKRTTFSGVVNL